MKRKRITEVLPFLLPLRIKQREFLYYTKMHFDEHKYSTIVGEYLSEEIIQTKTHTINKNTDFDIKYQLNKLYNLKLIAKGLDGLFIMPNETFSFNYAIREIAKKERFKEGLVIVNGEMKQEAGGGICHMSNQLYKTFLHTPLEIIERHPHQKDYFPQTNIHEVLGLDATVSSGWLDLKVKNNTSQSFQIKLNFVEDVLELSILSNREIDKSYRIKNRNVNYLKKNNKNYKTYDVIKETYIKNSLEKIDEHLVTSDFIELAYEI